jgi:hypothetical protein
MTRLRLSVLMVLVGVLPLLPPLANASSLDPSWIQGVYDDGDYDNVVTLINASAGVVEPFPLDGICSGALVIARPHQTDADAAQCETPSVSKARSPPAF